MLAKVFSGATVGLDCVPIEVEIDIASSGVPCFTIVGLPDKAVEEAKERVRSALKNSGADFPAKRITVNLAPADLPKEGPAYDLPIALGLLIASEQLKADVSDSLVLGELSLDGSLRHTSSILPIASLAQKAGFKKIFLPAVNSGEAAILDNIDVIPVRNLNQLFHHLSGNNEIAPQPKVKPDFDFFEEGEFDMQDIKGQEQVKRALEIAAAGGHNVLLKGPPGTGKTLLARAFPSILPNLTMEEALEATKIYSVCSLLSRDNPLIKKRPFRSPHHTTSHIGMIGGGTHPKPGEISLAHRGVLFLDELPEFSRQTLEALRQPLEDGHVTVSRAAGTVNFPAKFILIAAQNPCPCGFFGSQTKPCICSPSQITRYQKKISGPLLDRIDIHLDVPQVNLEKLTGDLKIEDSKTVRSRVQNARNIQTRRFTNQKITCNAEMTPKEIKEFCPLTDDALKLLHTAAQTMSLSARGVHRVLKLSRTIADLSACEKVEINHLAESLQYRPSNSN